MRCHKYKANLLHLATPSSGSTTAVLSACLRCLSGTLAVALAFADSANGPSYAHRSRREQEINSKQLCQKQKGKGAALSKRCSTFDFNTCV